EGFIDVARLPAQHRSATPLFALDQAIGHQAVDGTAYRGAADRQLDCNMLFAQALARQEGAGHQPPTQLSIDKITYAGHGGAALRTRKFSTIPNWPSPPGAAPDAPDSVARPRD